MKTDGGEYGKKRVLDVRVREPNLITYCDKCHKLHTEAEWKTRDDCSITAPSKKSLIRAKLGCKLLWSRHERRYTTLKATLWHLEPVL